MGGAASAFTSAAFAFAFALAGCGLDPVTPDPTSAPDGGAVGDGAQSSGDDGSANPTDAAPGVDLAPEPCPAGLGTTWTCDGDRRVRCVDAKLASVACPNGCTPALADGEAVCGCGANGSFSHWNCTADGDLHACAGGITWLSQSCGGRGCEVGPVGVSDACKPVAGVPLQALLDKLGPECGTYSPGTTCGLSVRDLSTGERAQFRGNAQYVSASSAKAIWVAAALYDTSIAQVMPFADPIFRNSDNYASGSVIDLLASPGRVNTFMWNDVGLPDSGFCNWSFGVTRHAANCPTAFGGDNFFSADDMALFLTALWDKSLLGDVKATQELEWMKLSPRSGYGGWLGTQLPVAARPAMHHKAGWLPPDQVPGYSNSNDIGIVEVPVGPAYAVALLLSGGSDYNGRQLPMLEYASCVIYHGVAKDVADPFGACTHP